MRWSFFGDSPSSLAKSIWAQQRGSQIQFHSIQGQDPGSKRFDDRAIAYNRPASGHRDRSASGKPARPLRRMFSRPMVSPIALAAEQERPGEALRSARIGCKPAQPSSTNAPCGRGCLGCRQCHRTATRREPFLPPHGAKVVEVGKEHTMAQEIDELEKMLWCTTLQAWLEQWRKEHRDRVGSPEMLIATPTRRLSVPTNQRCRRAS